MVDTVVSELDDLRQSWSRAVASMVWGHWLMLDAGLKAAQSILATAAPPAPAQTEELPDRALARVKKGLAPPREVYQAPYRDRINWAEFPDWARPSDPELYEGCAHEG